MPEGEEPKVPRNQAHQDQVSKAKNERMERHSGAHQCSQLAEAVSWMHKGPLSLVARLTCCA